MKVLHVTEQTITLVSRLKIALKEQTISLGWTHHFKGNIENYCTHTQRTAKQQKR